MSHDVVAGVDIGGTKIAAGLVDVDGRVTSRRTEATPEEAVDVVDTVANMLEALDPPAAAGVGSAGVIDPQTGAVVSATDAIRHWAGTKLRDELKARTGLRVAVDNDVHAHARGELWLGAARSHDTVLFVAVGTGIGASLVIDGRVYHGSRGVAGHLGHLPATDGGDRPCSCGGSGHVEAVASGPAMARTYAEHANAALTVTEMSQRADQGDEVAASIIADAGASVGRAIGGAVNVVDPEIVVVGGGVSHCGRRWMDALTIAARAELLAAAAGVPIVPAGLGPDAALVGAAHLAREVDG